jgi:hypothetical protein
MMRRDGERRQLGERERKVFIVLVFWEERGCDWRYEVKNRAAVVGRARVRKKVLVAIFSVVLVLTWLFVWEEI